MVSFKVLLTQNLFANKTKTCESYSKKNALVYKTIKKRLGFDTRDMIRDGGVEQL